MRHYPFGQQRWESGTDRTDIDFTDQRREAFGLLDYNARYYDPLIGRFTSADTIVPDFTDPQALNRYSYALGNPVRYNDPSGHMVDEGGAVGGGSGLVWAALLMSSASLMVSQDPQTIDDAAETLTDIFIPETRTGTVEGIDFGEVGELRDAGEYTNPPTLDKLTNPLDPPESDAVPRVTDFPLDSGPDEARQPFVTASQKFQKGDNIGLERFTKEGKRGVLIDPKTGEELRPDRGRNSGTGTHGGSYWKLYNKKGERLGTISEDGRWLRK